MKWLAQSFLRTVIDFKILFRQFSSLNRTLQNPSPLTLRLKKHKDTLKKFRAYLWDCYPEFSSRKCQSNDSLPQYHYPKQQPLLGYFRSSARFPRVPRLHLAFPTSSLVLWQLYSRRTPFKSWQCRKSRENVGRKSSFIFLPSGCNIVHVLFSCLVLYRPTSNVVYFPSGPWSGSELLDSRRPYLQFYFNLPTKYLPSTLNGL